MHIKCLTRTMLCSENRELLGERWQDNVLMRKVVLNTMCGHVLGQGLGGAACVHGAEAAQQRAPGAQPSNRVLAVQRQPCSPGCAALILCSSSQPFLFHC